MPHPNPLVRNLASLLSDEVLFELARKSGFLVRQRHLQLVPFFWTLVLGMYASPTKSRTGLQRLYHELTGTILASSSFQERFSLPLVAWLRAVFAHTLASAAAECHQLAGPLGALGDMIVIDSTVLRLHAALAARYPGCRTNHSPATAKLNLVYNVTQSRIQTATIAEGTRSEIKFFSPGAWVSGCLLLFDLGYFKIQTFYRIDKHNGYFISRLKENSAPVITAVHSMCRGRAIDPIGRKVSELLGDLQRQLIDCQVSYQVTLRGLPGRPKKGKKPGQVLKSDTLSLRFVAVRNAETGRYHTYLTNIPPDKLSAKEVAEAYRARWLVELFFKEMRSTGGLGAWPNQKEPAVLAGIYAALLGMVVNRRLLLALKDQMASRKEWNERRLATMRWTKVLADHAAAFLNLLIGTLKQNHLQVKAFVNMLLRESVEPKRIKLRLEAHLGI